MKNIEVISDKELWVLPYDSLMEILEQDAKEKIEGMSRDELDLVFEQAMAQRQKNCDIKKIAEQTDEENHECIKLNVLQNAAIDKSKEIMFEQDHPDLYDEMKNRNITFKSIEQLLCAPKVINGELIHHTPSFAEVIEYMYNLQVVEEKQQYAR